MKISVDFLDRDQHASVAASANNLYAKMLKWDTDPSAGGLNCRELIWPSLSAVKKVSPELKLIPLNRVGAEQGFGGSYVMIVYFIDQANKIYPSKPLVVKISKPSEKDKGKLKDEWNSGVEVRSYITYHNDSFAIPLHFDELPNQKHAVLWSPFSSSEYIWGKLDAHIRNNSKILTLQVSDLWRVLRKNYVHVPEVSNCNPNEVLEKVYRITRPLHDRVGLIESRRKNIVTEYKRYLRHFTKKKDWGARICGMWKGKMVKEQSQEFYNPILCLDKLRRYETSLRFGAIHGDLHPKNIVLTENDEPRVIDFGWAGDNKHIAKDFVLMECNLRFVALRPDVGLKDLSLMTNWIGFDEKPPKAISADCKARIALIEKLRELARTRFPINTNWDDEYIIPLFLVAFGLLRVLSSMDNQLAARITVLKLSSYLKNRLKL